MWQKYGGFEAVDQRIRSHSYTGNPLHEAIGGWSFYKDNDKDAIFVCII